MTPPDAKLKTMRKRPGNSIGQKAYPKVVCWECANPIKKVRDMGAITVHRDTCEVCGKVTGVSTPGDYGWPDFPSFKKVKRLYEFD